MASCLDLITNAEERAALTEDFWLLKKVDTKRPAKEAYIEAAQTRLADHESLLQQLEDEIVKEYQAKYPAPKTVSNKTTVAQVKAMLPDYAKKLVDSGVLNMVQSSKDAPETAKSFKAEGVEGYYDQKNDKLYLIADNINKDNLKPILQHELFHRSLATDPLTQKAVANFTTQMQASFDRAAKGDGTKIEREAYKRVVNAKTPESDQLEEYMAYQISAFQANPESFTGQLQKAFKEFIAAIRAALMRMGVKFSDVTAADLSALAEYGAKSNLSGSLAGSRVLASAKAQGYEGNDTGEAEEWLRAKAKGLDMSKAARMERAKAMGFDVDNVYYHGTNKDIKSFNNFVSWFTKDSKFASEYADLRDVQSGGGGNVMPVYLKYDSAFNADYLSKGSNKVNEFVTELASQSEVDYDDKEILELLRTIQAGAKEEESGPYYSNYDFWYDPYGLFGEKGANAISKLFKKLGYDSINFTEDGTPTVGIINKNQIRSINAAFDPDYADSSNLLASAKDTDQTKLKSFKAWFKGSKAVDENGEPAIFYHGTGTDFNIFDYSRIGTNGRAEGGGFYFTSNKDVASGYADGGEVKQVYLAIKKPMKYDSKPFNRQVLTRILDAIARAEAEKYEQNIGDGFLSNYGDVNYEGYQKVLREAANAIAEDETALDQLGGLIGSGIDIDLINRAVTDITGFDGIESSGFANQGDSTNKILVAFFPNQIKSATGNNGDFSNDNPDIRFSIASDIKDKAIDWATGRERNPNSLSDFENILATGHMPTERREWSEKADRLVEMFADSTRPFDVWTRSLPDELAAARLVMAKDRAVERKKAFEKEAMLSFGNDIARAVRAVADKTGWKYAAAKEMSGHWMTARYAQIANANLLRGYEAAEQAAIDELNEAEEPTAELEAAVERATAKVEQFKAAMNDPNVVDPNETQHSIGLAGGYNNATARALMAQIEARVPRDLLEVVANPVYAMNKWKLQQDIKNGKVTQDVADKFDQSGLYVPLTGDPRTDDSQEDFFSTGSVNQQKDQRMQGRTSGFAQNGIDASFEQVEKSGRYHGWVDFKDELSSMYNGLVAQYTDEGMTQREAEDRVREDYGISRHAEHQGQRISDDGIIVRKNGITHVYELGNKAATDALRSLNNEDVPTLLKPLQFLNAWNARFVTQFMPMFAIKNMVMDTFERSENIRTRTVPGYDNVDMNKAGRRILAIAATAYPLAAKLRAVVSRGTALESRFPIDYNDPETASIMEFLNEGGASTWGDYLGNNGKALSSKLAHLSAKGVEGGYRTAMEMLSVWNNSLDLVSGYAAYKALREQGVDPKTAATTSLNLFNFSKRGKIMSPIRALYMFAQPAMTSAHQLAQTLGTRRGRARYGAYVIAGMGLYALLRSGEDDDELGVNKLDEVGNYNLARNIMIPLGDGKYMKIPVGFGLPQLAWSHAVNLVKFAMGNQTAAETLVELGVGAAKSAAPVAPSDTNVLDHPAIWLFQTFTPQPMKGLLNIGMDVTSMGNKLTTNYPREGVAHALQGRKTTPQFYKDIAVEMAKLGFDVYPEQLREFTRQYAPIPAITSSLLKQYVDNPAREARGQQTVSPALDRWIFAQDNDALTEKLYYRKLDRVEALAARDSAGGSLSAEDKRLAAIGREMIHRMNQANGKLAAATKAEKKGEKGKALMFRNQADKLRDANMKYLIREVK